IDECVTGSYHLTALEGAALGRVTLSGSSEPIEQVMLKASGASTSPFRSTHIDHLESTLEELLALDRSEVISLGRESREWMEKHWHPQAIVNDFMDIYLSL